jgi:hypothetical protein
MVEKRWRKGEEKGLRKGGERVGEIGRRLKSFGSVLRKG